MIEKTQKKEKGIICKKDIAVSYPKKKSLSWFSCFLEIIVIMVVSATTMGGFINGCEIEINQKLYFTAVALLSILFYVSFLQKKWGGILLIGEIAAYGATGYYYRKEISDGLALVVNILFQEIENYFGIELVEYQVNSQDKLQSTTIFLIYISVFLVGFIAYIIRNELPVMLLLFATIWIAFVPEMVGFVPALEYRLGYITSLFVYGGSNLYKRKITEKKLSAQKRIQGKVRLFQMISIGMCIGIFSLILGEGTYKELTKDKSFKVAVQESIRRGMDNLIRGTFCQGSVNGGINFGELGEVDGIEYTGETKLKLRLEKKEFDPVYLRGYIGSYYQDNTWSGLTEEEEEKKQRLEAISNIKVEDYQAALLYYYLVLLKYNNNIGEVYQTEEEEELNGFPDYQTEGKVERIKKLFPQFMGKVEIDNIAETYGTLFTPYYISGDLQEKNGKLSIEGKKNQSYYEWNVVQAGVGIANFINTEDDYCLNNWFSQEFLAGMEAVTEDAEERLGKRLEEYSTESIENVTIGELLGISEDWEYLDEEAYVHWGLNNYADIDAKTMLEILKNLKIFRNYQQQYENYVEQTYLEVPEGLKKQLLNTLNQMQDKWGFHNGIQSQWLEGIESLSGEEDAEWKKLLSKLLLVKEYLKENTSYTLTPGAVPEGKDFVTYFLYENKKGFCTHYATTATLMLRSLGIPARYVEGYMAGSTDLKIGKYENDYLAVELTDENAHAWVEIYIKDYGWVPVEMTPGYSEGFEVKEIIEKEESQTPDSTPAPESSSSPNSSDKKNPVKITLPIIKKLKATLRNIALTFLVLLGIWLRRFLICRYRKRKEKQRNFSDCIIFLYKEIDRILCVKKYKRKEEDLREWLQNEKEDILEGITKEQWEELLVISNRCAFSNKPPLLDDVETSRKIYHTLQENSYKNSSVLKRLFYRYVKVM